MTDADRALSAFTDVLAVEYDTDAEMMRIITLSDVYHAVPRDGLHMCPDRKYNLDGEGHCKHTVAADITRGRIDVPAGWLIAEDLDDRDADRPDDCECSSQDLECWTCRKEGYESPNPAAVRAE